MILIILDIAQKDAFTQVQPRHRHVGLQCHMKEKSTLTKMIKSVKKVSTDPERLRKRNGFQIFLKIVFNEKTGFLSQISPDVKPAIKFLQIHEKLKSCIKFSH